MVLPACCLSLISPASTSPVISVVIPSLGRDRRRGPGRGQGWCAPVGYSVSVLAMVLASSSGVARPWRIRQLPIGQCAGHSRRGMAEPGRAFFSGPEVFDAFVSLTATEQRHTLGTSHPERYNPDTWTDEYAHLSKPGQREIQADLLYDYRTNVASYSVWQAWLREHKPPTLVVWGRNDPSFIAPGAEAFERDLPDAEIHLLDAGHFALDEKNDEIASLILAFLAKHSGLTDR